LEKGIIIILLIFFIYIYIYIPKDNILFYLIYFTSRVYDSKVFGYDISLKRNKTKKAKEPTHEQIAKIECFELIIQRTVGIN